MQKSNVMTLQLRHKPLHGIHETKSYKFGGLVQAEKLDPKTLKQALIFTQKAFINSSKPLCELIDYQTLTRGSHPALFIKKRTMLYSGFEPQTLISEKEYFTTKPRATI